MLPIKTKMAYSSNQISILVRRHLETVTKVDELSKVNLDNNLKAASESNS